jgi:hypothetical protein
MFHWIKKLFTKEKHKEVLFFSDKAVHFLKDHFKSLPQESRLIFQVVRDKKGKGLVQVGFDKDENENVLEIQDAIPISFRNQSKEILEGCAVDLDDNGNFLVYPRIDLETRLSPNAQILIFISNKKFLSDDSQLTYGAWEKSEKVQKPFLIESLFKIKFIESIYIEKYKIQIELKQQSSWAKFEEKVSEVIINYLETLPRPMKITTKDS